MVPEGVVELLEMVQVDDEQRYGPVVVVSRGYRPLQSAQQLTAVGE